MSTARKKTASQKLAPAKLPAKSAAKKNSQASPKKAATKSPATNAKAAPSNSKKSGTDLKKTETKKVAETAAAPKVKSEPTPQGKAKNPPAKVAGKPEKTKAKVAESPAKVTKVVAAKKEVASSKKPTASAAKPPAAKPAAAVKQTKPEIKKGASKPIVNKGVSLPANKPASKDASKSAAKELGKTIEKGSIKSAAEKKTSASEATTVKQPAKAAVMKPVKKAEPTPKPSNTNPEIVAKIRNAQVAKELRKDLAQPSPKPSLISTTPVPPVEKGKDRLILMVRDAYWLHAHWDITRQSVERARVSIAENWHNAKPILRLLKLDDTGTTNNAETVFQDIEVHGGVRNWYLQIETPGCSFKMLMGYITSNGRFYELARSNTVTMPMPGSKDASDDHWAEIAKDAEKIYAMSGGYNEDTQSGDLEEVFEERLKRTMDTDVLSQFGSGAEGGLKRHKQFHFEVDAELVVFGSTHPDAHVNVGGEPVKVRTDGTFSIRMALPDRRQVLPATAKSRDGVDEQTVVIAVERNTKVMEPLSMDADDL